MYRIIIYFLFLRFSLSVSAQQMQQNNSPEIRIIPNKGQRMDDCEAYAKTGSTLFRMFGTKYLLTFVNSSEYDSLHNILHSKTDLSKTARVLSGQNIEVNFIGANKYSETFLSEPFDEYFNFLGKNDANLIKLNPVKKIVKKEIYNGIDLLTYSVGTLIKMDWLVRPIGNIEQIKILYEGVSELKINESGHLAIKHNLGEYFEFKCTAYQLADFTQIPIDCSYKITGNEVSFKLGEYDHSKDLIIDPILVFSTYSGSQGDNFGYCATNDLNGNLYTAGIVNAIDGDYPVTPGAFQLIYGGCGSPQCYFPCDISISKYSTDGKQLLYASYLGGSRFEYPHSINIDPNNNLLILGSTNSSNFPTTLGAFQENYQGGGSDLFVAKISEDGTTLKACTYLGGSANDGENADELIFFHNDYYRGDIIGTKNKIYIGGYVSSDDMPLSNNAFQSSFGGKQDGYLAWFSPDLDTLIYGSYYGGKMEDAIYSIRLNKDKTKLYVAGGAGSDNLPMSGGGFVSVYESGEADSYIASFNTLTGKLIESTFLGVAFMDEIFMIDIDNQDRINVFGLTYGPIMKTKNQYGYDARGQFIARFNSTLNTQEFITTFGSYTYPNPHLSPSAFMVDKCNNIYLSAWGSGVWYANGYSSGTTADLPITSNTFQSTTDSNDFYLMVLSENAEKLIFASYMGGNKTADHIDGGMSRFDQDGIVYQSVCASCPNEGESHISDFPVDKNALYARNESYRCSNASFKLDFRVSNITKSIFDVTPSRGCVPLKSKFNNFSTSGNYKWDFGDGTESNETNPEHVFNKPGKYNIKLSVTNSKGCGSFDSSSAIVEVNPGLEYDFFENSCEKSFSIKSKNNEIVYVFYSNGTMDSGVTIYKKFIKPGVENIWIRNKSDLCPDSSNHTISIVDFSLDSVLIPNIFTPDGDGLNECYFIKNIGSDCIEHFSLSIFNRWGQKVFETNDKNVCWNGKINNRDLPLPEGTYLSIIQMKTWDKKVHSITGTITLIK